MLRSKLVPATALAVLSLGFGTVEGPAAADAATPVRGGTLTILGQSDIFNLDTVSAYYTVSYILERLYTRQLFSYPDASNFPAEEVVTPDVATVIPTTSNGGITNGGKTYTMHIRQGVMWDTSPARQVTSDDFVREFKMLCNPASPVGAPGYFETTIDGMASYCSGFSKVKDTVAAINAYETGTPLAGVSAPDPSTLVFKLMEPSADFLNILSLPFDSARPVEYMKYLPDSATFRQNTLSDGPYQITSYSPGKGFTLDRNSAWKQSTDTLRHAYVNKVIITEGLTTESVQEQLQAGTGDMEWDVQPPFQDLPGLEGSSNLVIGPPGNYYVSLNVYLALNQYAGPFTNKLVREAAAYAVDKNSIVQILGGSKLAAVANQPIIPGNTGYIPGYNPYPDKNGNGDAAKAKALLKQAGYPHGLTIKLLYSTTLPAPRVAQALQASLTAAGFNVKFVPVTGAAFYGSYLENPSTSKRDVWDMAAPGWIPDWFGNNGRAILEPIFTDPGNGSNDFGGYSSPVTNSLINKALGAPDLTAAAKLWSQAERQIMSDSAAIPVEYQKWPVYHSSAVHGCTFWWFDLDCDPTNVWLSS